MPYIEQIDRQLLSAGRSPNTAGELNFIFTTIITEYLADHGTNYQNINDIVGALEGAKLEFYRRVAVPYEDLKIKENGDVYE